MRENATPPSRLRRSTSLFAPTRLAARRCFGRLIFRKSFHLFLQNARPPGSLRSPFEHTGEAKVAPFPWLPCARGAGAAASEGFWGSPFVGRSAAEACAFWSQSPGGALTENKPCATPERPEGAFRCEECKGSCHAHGGTEGLFVPPTQKGRVSSLPFLFYAKSFHASGAISSTARGRQRISAWVRCPAHSPSAVHSAGSSKSMLTCPAEKK